MSRIDDGRRRHRIEPLKTLEHVVGVAPGQIGPAATVEEQRVAGDQTAMNVKALAAGRVARGVDEVDRHGTDLDRVASRVGTELGLAQTGGARHPRNLVLVDVNRNLHAFEQTSDTFDPVAHHRAAHMIGVIVGRQHARHSESVTFHDVDEIVDAVRRVDDDAFAGAAIPDQVDEVGHLGGQRIADCEIVSGQELPKVEVVRHRPYANRVSMDRLTRLESGQLIPFGGDRVTVVSDELASSFVPGDRLVVVQETGDLIRVPASVSELVQSAVSRARRAFSELSRVDDANIDRFYDEMATRMEDDRIMSSVLRANGEDVDDARSRGRSTTRLELTDKMRRDMIEGVRIWRRIDVTRDASISVVDHGSWRVEERRAPLGVIAFVFEGRPNVFADATGVLRSGNSVVFRIGSDALRTAQALMDDVVGPSLASAGLPAGSVVLVASPDRSAGHALFSDRRIALAVARGSGEAVAQLGSVARQAGVPVSLHGTGGAWMVIAPDADVEAIEAMVDASLDRKVCNTLNVVCVARDRPEHLSAVLSGVRRAGERRSARPAVHVRAGAPIDHRALGDATVVEHDDDSFLGVEYEWDDRPELAVRIVETVGEAVQLCNDHSPWFVTSLITRDDESFEDFYRGIEAPFVGDGFTRWVDGQYALRRPELGLSNWQSGRLFGRGGILSGDGVFAVRYVARHTDPTQRR
ncbi:MAG: hypothetical protein RLZZ269_1971 [Actinomycetota bacterium]